MHIQKEVAICTGIELERALRLSLTEGLIEKTELGGIVVERCSKAATQESSRVAPFECETTGLGECSLFYKVVILGPHRIRH